MAMTLLICAALAVGPAEESWVGKRFYGCYENHLKQQDIQMLTEFFYHHKETWQWQTEFWGKFMHSAVPFADCFHDEDFKARIAAGVKRMEAAQLDDGYIGNYQEGKRAQEMWDIWGMKYTLLGLLHWYDSTQDATALATAEKLAGFVLKEIGPHGKRRIVQTGNYCGLASCSILEPIVWLYRVTKRECYREFAAEIVRQVGYAEDGPQLVTLAFAHRPLAERDCWRDVKHNRTKAYEMMSCLQGMLDYADLGPENAEELREAVRISVKQALAEEINIIGGAGSNEHWYGGARKQTQEYMHPNETCVTTTWLRLLERLHRLDGDAALASAWERSFYNVYLGAQSPDCRYFASYPPLNGYRQFQREQLKGVKTNCCNANGARGFVSMLHMVLTVREGKAYLNTFIPGVWETEGRRVRIKGNYPMSDEVEVEWEGFELFRRDGDRYVRCERKFSVPLAWRKVEQDGYTAMVSGPVVLSQVQRDRLIPYADAQEGFSRVWVPNVRNPGDDYPEQFAPRWREAVAEDLAHGVYTNVDWNVNARLFMYPPTFAFPADPQAKSYLLLVVDAKGGMHQLNSSKPRFSLESIWAELPTGWTSVECFSVQHRDDRNVVMGARMFWKQAPFTGNYPPAAKSYSNFNDQVMKWTLNHPGVGDFIANGRPSTAKYWGFCYPAKMVSALINAFVVSAERDAAKRAEYLQNACIFADWMISISEKPEAPLAYFPPTYWCEDRARAVGVVRDFWDEIMLHYPAAIGLAYTELYRVSGQQKYLDQAIGIANTFLKLQGADGTVPLKMFKNGQPSKPNRLQPIQSLIPFLDRLHKVTKEARYAEAMDRAFAFVENGPMKDADWDGQFEDVEPDSKYRNLTKHDAASTVIFLCERYAQDREKIAAARELLRFCEDQFVCWEVPFAGRLPAQHNTQDVPRWICPGVLEQYYWYVPIDASASKMIRAYVAMYQAEKNPLDLAKAKALADAMTRLQRANGTVPTHWYGEQGCSWINCILSDVVALEVLLEAERQ